MSLRYWILILTIPMVILSIPDIIYDLKCHTWHFFPLDPGSLINADSYYDSNGCLRDSFTNQTLIRGSG